MRVRGSLQFVAVCCSVLQCVAVRCSVMQSIAVYCSVLQCGAVWCSVLQCVAVLPCLTVHCSASALHLLLLHYEGEL